MTVELHVDEGAVGSAGALEALLANGPLERGRPNVSGDLPSVLSAAPMFRRVVAGYDRFQVDTYVQWAEDELAAADREREHLVERSLRTSAALEEARERLAHSAGADEFLQVSRRIGALLATAADEAEDLRAEARADRCAASAEAERTLSDARQALADAADEARRMLAEAATEVEGRVAEGQRIVRAAERTLREAGDEAEARLAQIRVVEQLAVDDAAEVRRRAETDASAARLQARAEIVGILGTARDERRRADAEAAGVRERLDHEAALRRTALLSDVERLEQRRTALRAEIELLGTVAGPVVSRSPRSLRLLERFGPRSLRAH